MIGIWLGLSCALGYASVVSFMLVWRADWTRAVERVRERLGLGARGEVGEDGKWVGDENGDLMEEEEEDEAMEETRPRVGNGSALSS